MQRSTPTLTTHSCDNYNMHSPHSVDSHLNLACTVHRINQTILVYLPHWHSSPPRLRERQWVLPLHQLRACPSAGEAMEGTLSMAIHTQPARTYLQQVLIITRIYQSILPLRHRLRQGLLLAGSPGPANKSPFIPAFNDSHTFPPSHMYVTALLLRMIAMAPSCGHISPQDSTRLIEFTHMPF
jgi:hypothetical protein